MRKGTGEVLLKNILFRFKKGQTHFDMPICAKVSFPLNALKSVALPSNSTTTSEHACQAVRNYGPLMQNNLEGDNFHRKVSFSII